MVISRNITRRGFFRRISISCLLRGLYRGVHESRLVMSKTPSRVVRSPRLLLVNVVGNCLASAAMACWEGEFDLYGNRASKVEVGAM